jgi:hypothetical protein
VGILGTGVVWLIGTLCLLAAGCAPERSRARATEGTGIFVDEYPRSGIDFVLGHGGKTPLDILETLGHGAAMLDVDGDGRLDLLLLGPDRLALYRNRGDWRFEDVTASSGLARRGYWQGVATGDVDGDGRVDLFLCGYGVAALYRNRGEAAGGPPGSFEDVTEAAGLKRIADRGSPIADERPATDDRRPTADRSQEPGARSQEPIPWNTSAGFADVDGDGWLDLYVARYVRFGPDTPRHCRTDQPGVRSVCPPKVYEPQRGVFYRNVGRGRFREETRERGLDTAHGNALGVAFGDENDDGRVDLAVANDELPGDLFRNVGRGRFRNIGPESGTAYDADGRVHGGMGIDWGDLDGDGRLDLVVTTFSNETKNLYRNEGGDLFRDVAVGTEFGRVGRPYVGFGVKFFDLENDGDSDLVIANGHVADNAARLRRGDSYPQPTLLFRNDAGQFHDITALGGSALARPIVGRGVCAGDLDQDGRVDLVVTNVEGPPLLLRNRCETPGRWLQVLLRGKWPNRHGIGARVAVRAGGRRQVREVTTGGSYLSAGDPCLHFGLGSAPRVDELVVRWPGGAVSRMRDVAVDQRVTVVE